jgi:hypothetical protein
MGIEWKDVTRGSGSGANIPTVPAVRVTYRKQNENLAFIFTRQCLDRYGWSAGTRLQIAVNYSRTGSVLELLWRENPDCGYMLQVSGDRGNVYIKGKEKRADVIEKAQQLYSEWRHVEQDECGVFFFGDLVNGKG